MIRIFLPDDFAQKPPITEVYGDLIPKILDQWEALPAENTIRTDPPRSLDTRAQRESFLWDFLTAKEFYRYQIRRTCPFWRALDALADKTALSSILGDPAAGKPVQKFRKNYPPRKWADYYGILKTFQSEQNNAALSDFKKGFILDPLQVVFSYDHLTDEQRHTILTAMDIPVCPYCNMNYILTYDRDGKLRTTADLDHFYVKSRHPEYALCLYNMIPSCQVCNSRLKGTKDMTVGRHIYPHENSFAGKAEFHVENMVDYLLDQNSPKNQPRISLDISPETPADEKDRIRASAGMFRLEPRYRSVPDTARQLIDKAQIYTDGYNEDLADAFSNAFEGASIKEMAFGPEETEQEYSRHSLGKLRMDLLKQMGIY